MMDTGTQQCREKSTLYNHNKKLVHYHTQFKEILQKIPTGTHIINQSILIQWTEVSQLCNIQLIHKMDMYT